MNDNVRTIINCKAVFNKEPSATSRQLRELNIESEEEDLTVTSDVNIYLDRIEMINKTINNDTVVHLYSGKSLLILVKYDEFSKIFNNN